MKKCIMTGRQPIKFEDGMSKYVVELRCHSAADIPEPEPDWLTGSLALDISSGSFYALNADGVWVSQQNGAELVRG